MASAVDVARDAADIILKERDLGVLHKGIIEGRKAFANVMKYPFMGTSSNFGNMFSTAGAVLFLPPTRSGAPVAGRATISSSHASRETRLPWGASTRRRRRTLSA